MVCAGLPQDHSPQTAYDAARAGHTQPWRTCMHPASPSSPPHRCAGIHHVLVCVAGQAEVMRGPTRQLHSSHLAAPGPWLTKYLCLYLQECSMICTAWAHVTVSLTGKKGSLCLDLLQVTQRACRHHLTIPASAIAASSATAGSCPPDDLTLLPVLGLDRRSRFMESGSFSVLLLLLSDVRGSSCDGGVVSLSAWQRTSLGGHDLPACKAEETSPHQKRGGWISMIER